MISGYLNPISKITCLDISYDSLFSSDIFSNNLKMTSIKNLRELLNDYIIINYLYKAVM